jgi:endo-1,4-beta-xylanase
VLRGRPRLLGRSIKLGAAARSDRLTDRRYRRTLVRNFDSLTPENEMKMFLIQPRRGRFDFRPADSLVRLARRNGMTVRGHTLVYGLQLPRWITHPRRPWTRKTLLRVMRRHIARVVRHYRGRVSQWDVVNEPLNSAGRFTPNVWFKTIGPSYVAHALRAARRADPGASLFINENSAEVSSNARSRALYRLARRLKRRGVPIDGVGLQNHTDTATFPGRRALQTTMARFARLGLTTEVTEMDVAIDTRRSRGEQLWRQALAFTAAEEACRAVARCARITSWGFTDNTTWRGSENQPLLFDRRYREKPAYKALARGVGLPSNSRRRAD